MIESGLLVFIVGQFFLEDSILLAEALNQNAGLSQFGPEKLVFLEELVLFGVVLVVHILKIKFYKWDT